MGTHMGTLVESENAVLSHGCHLQYPIEDHEVHGGSHDIVHIYT